jgi:phage-related protein
MERRRWRLYRTQAGRSPVREFLDGLSDSDAASVAAAMRQVAADGLAASRHLTGDIYEVRADGDRQAYRILFATEGRYGQVLVALEAFSKKTQRAPAPRIAVAQRRLADWRGRGRSSHG